MKKTIYKNKATFGYYIGIFTLISIYAINSWWSLIIAALLLILVTYIDNMEVEG